MRALVLLLAWIPALCAAGGRSAGPVEVAEQFARALHAGDAAAARALLLPQVLVYEFGAAENSAAEYAAQHLPADMAFLKGLKREQLERRSGGDGTLAWVATRSRLQGRHQDRDVDLDSTETLVLQRTQEGWRIAHIHWSSAPHRPARN